MLMESSTLASEVIVFFTNWSKTTWINRWTLVISQHDHSIFITAHILLSHQYQVMYHQPYTRALESRDVQQMFWGSGAFRGKCPIHLLQILCRDFLLCPLQNTGGWDNVRTQLQIFQTHCCLPIRVCSCFFILLLADLHAAFHSLLTIAADINTTCRYRRYWYQQNKEPHLLSSVF